MENSTPIEHLVPGITYRILSKHINPEIHENLPKQGKFLKHFKDIYGEQKAKFEITNVPGIPKHIVTFSSKDWYFKGMDIKGGRRRSRKATRKGRKSRKGRKGSRKQ